MKNQFVALSLRSMFRSARQAICGETGLAVVPSIGEERLGRQDHIKLAVSWLRVAQRATSDGGFSKGFSLATGHWASSYPETTGYIIPTLLCCGVILRDDSLACDAIRAADWLVDIQSSDGFFTAMNSPAPMVFDTGQCLEGLYLAGTYSNYARFGRAAKMATDWLISVQAHNGSWTEHIFNSHAKAYYGRVGASLLVIGKLTMNSDAFRAGLKNLEWTQEQQEASGMFKHCNFDGHPTYLHTLGYATASLMRGYLVTEEKWLLDGVIKNVNGLLSATAETMKLPVQAYGKNWKPLSSKICTAGLAQYAAILFTLARLFPRELRYREQGLKYLDFLAGIQIKSGANVRGAIPPSEPPFKSYVGTQIVNWGTKFFLDALILFECTNSETFVSGYRPWLI